MLELKIKKVHPDALPLRKTHKEDACYDLCACEDVEFLPGEIKVVNTGWKMEPPPGWRLNVYVRSSTPTKKGFILGNSVGIIDSSYRGLILIQLMNIKVESKWESVSDDYGTKYDKKFFIFCKNKINKGDRIAQIELVKDRPECKIVEVNELSNTARDTGAFGSTG